MADCYFTYLLIWKKIYSSNTTMVGHIGRDKILDIIAKSYWFPNAKEKCVSDINNCLKCVAISPSIGKEGFLHSIPKGSKPFELIHIDHYGPVD